jgi:Protein of unknown function (DUF3800)
LTDDGLSLGQPTLDFDLHVDKQERVEAEKATLIRAVASAKLDTIQERVAWVLNHFPETRNSDITLQIKYWERFESDLYEGRAVEPEDMYKLTRLTSLQRARAKIQNTYGLFQASPDVKRRRGKLSEEEKEKAVAQQPDDPIFAVYADESGKTQEHLVVGSMWFPYAEELGSLTLAIQALKSRHGFKGELHFKEINASKLPFYKALARLVREMANTFSFKAVSVERRGVGNVDGALRDLYYVLLREGVKHEVESGRAVLPRKLQLLKDAEEPGSDKLLLEDLKDRMFAASANLFDSELKPDVFEVEDSALSEVLQVADLFTSSISRRLNAASYRKQPKDELAEYFVEAVNLTSATTKDEVRGDVVYHLTL